jgi:hypothetical protein
MARTLADRVSDYHRDPYFPTWLPYAVVLGLRDWIWYRGDGQARWFKPSRFPNPFSWLVNRWLFTEGYKVMPWWVRALLALGF